MSGLILSWVLALVVSPALAIPPPAPGEDTLTLQLVDVDPEQMPVAVAEVLIEAGGRDDEAIVILLRCMEDPKQRREAAKTLERLLLQSVPRPAWSVA